MSALLNVFAIIGLVGVLIVIIYFIWKYLKTMTKNAMIAKERPSPAYMEQVGLKCPDYWMLDGFDDDGNYICKDKMDIMKMPQYKKSSKNKKCINKGKAVFSRFESNTPWVDMSDDEKIAFVASKAGNRYSRAEWIKQCGPNVGNKVSTRAVWSGLDKYV